MVWAAGWSCGGRCGDITMAAVARGWRWQARQSGCKSGWLAAMGTGGWGAALCSMQAARQSGARRLANGTGQRRAAEVCRAANLGAGRLGSTGHAVWLTALGVGRRLKNVAKRHCARCRRLGSPGHAGWLTAPGNGGRLKMAASRSGQAGRVAALRTGRQAADGQPVTVG